MNRKQDLGRLAAMLDVLTLIGGLVILFTLSWDIIRIENYLLSPSFLELQLIVCIVFLADFFARLSLAEDKGRFFLRNLFLLLVSIPYLNILQWCNADLSRTAYIVAKTAPLLRGFYSVFIIVGWLTHSRIRSLTISYIFTVIGFTYYAALVFYSYERGVNPRLEGFGNSFWWAWMNVTTVGASIFAVTTIGKILSVMLPALGMMMFPIFTAFIVDKFQKYRKELQDTSHS